MKIGDTAETGIWMTGDEPGWMVEQFKQDAWKAISDLCEAHNLRCGPMRVHVLHPEHERVPPVPDHIQGSRVELLICEADIVAPIVESPVGSFLANLDLKDLERLREITRIASHKNKRGLLTDAQCDEIIEELGPDAAVESLRSAVDTGQVH